MGCENVERIVTVEESTKMAHKRIDKVEENQKLMMEMNTNIRLIVQQNTNQDEKIDKIETNITKVNEKVDRLEKKPLLMLKNNCSKLKWLVIGTLVSSIVSYFLLFLR